MICHNGHGPSSTFRAEVVENLRVPTRGPRRRKACYGRPQLNEAVLWWRRTGVPWRDLPSDFGPWKTVFNRFDRWAKTGKWERLFMALQTDRDDEWHSLDSTINLAHQHASGGKGGLRHKA